MARTPVPKTGSRAIGRVRFPNSPRLEDDLAVARVRFAEPRDLRGLAFDSPVFRGGKNMETVIVEVRSAEGGNDSKLLVLEQRAIYLRLCARRGL
jgi:hypothetical protein